MMAIQDAAMQTLTSVALGAITLLGVVAAYYIARAAQKVRAMTRQIRDEETRQLFLDTIDDTEHLAQVTVGAFEQTTAKALREAVKDGKVDREELVDLSKQAFNEIKRKVSPEAQALITKNFGSFDDYLLNVIESKVLEIKTATGQLAGTGR